MKANPTIRELAKQNKVFFWQVANRLGISEPTLIRWMRTPLSEDREKAVTEAIKAIAKEEQ